MKLRYIPYGREHPTGPMATLTIRGRTAQGPLPVPRRAAYREGARPDYLSAEEDLSAARVLRGPVRGEHDRFLPYSDRVFDRFWKHELDVEKPDAIDALLTEVGLDTSRFHRYARRTDARADLDRLLRGSWPPIKSLAVPTFMADSEPFWVRTASSG